jgi:pimeloyl-ACP methyl ester carboxylesterase
MIKTLERSTVVQPVRRRRKLWAGTILAVATAAAILSVYTSYRNDIDPARQRIAAGSKIIDTDCGPIEYATLGEGAPVLVLHGTSGGWDQAIDSARGLVPYGFQIIAPSRLGYLGTSLRPDSLPPAEADTWICLLDALKLQHVPVISYSAGAAPAMQLALRHPERIAGEIFFVPGSGGICPACIDEATNPPRLLLDALYRFDFPMWLIMKLAPKFMYTLVAVPSSLVPMLSPEDRADLDSAIKSILPVSPRRLGVLNEGNTQGTQIQYPLEQVTTPTLFISAADDLYKTLPVAQYAVRIIPNAQLIEFPTGGHLLLGRGKEIWPAVADFLRNTASASPWSGPISIPDIAPVPNAKVRIGLSSSAGFR